MAKAKTAATESTTSEPQVVTPTTEGTPTPAPTEGATTATPTETVSPAEPSAMNERDKAAEELAAIKKAGLSAGNFSELKTAFVDLVELIQRMTGTEDD